jgi:molybdopterin converting factor subunit 1
MKSVTVHYFALLREQAGRSEETVRTAAGDPAALFAELRARHGFTLGREALKVAVNDDFAGWETVLREGDRVVFIPPVAGG